MLVVWFLYGDVIVFDNVILWYVLEFEFVFKNVIFVILGGICNVVVIGCIGLGKSILVLSLLGILYFDVGIGGLICIGNVDFVDVDKYVLRKNIIFVV